MATEREPPMPSRLLQFDPEIDSLMPTPHAWEARSDELALAASLLEQVEMGELEAYLVDLIDRATPVQRRVERPRVRALAGVLGSLARRVLRRRDVTRISAVGRLFGLELEGLSAEDQLFELACQFVRFSRAAARRAARADGNARPAAVARGAALAAARLLAPGLAPLIAARGPAGPDHLFRWGRDPVVLDSQTPRRSPTAVARSFQGD